MSAKKLSRLAGFVFVLAAVFGGAATATAAPASDGSSTMHLPVESDVRALGDIIWT